MLIENDCMMKKIFIVGCSYTHWHDGKCIGRTYPALIAIEYPYWHVYDASYGGSANDSVWWRLQHLEQKFGPPNKVIVQWTHVPRTQKIYSDSDIDFNNTKYYTDEYGCRKVSPPNYTFSSNEHLTNKFLTIRAETLSSLPNVEEKFYIDYLDSYHHTVYITQKEIDLVNGVYGEENVLMFDWHNHFSPGSECTMPNNWIGSVENAFKHKKKFKKLGVDNVQHYGSKGHSEVYKWLNPYLERLLDANN